MKTAEIINITKNWIDKDLASYLDHAFAEFLINRPNKMGYSDEKRALLYFSAFLTSRALAQNHICLDLDAFIKESDTFLTGENSFEIEDESLIKPSEILEILNVKNKANWIERLKELTDFISIDQDQDKDRISFNSKNPLILYNDCLYLKKYRFFEKNFFLYIDRMLNNKENQNLWPNTNESEKAIHSEILSLLFDDKPQPINKVDGNWHDKEKVNWNKVACALATRSKFSIITGGPGTGKTYTILRLMAFLQYLNFLVDGEKKPLKIVLAAPTGKAATRITESITKGRETIENALKNINFISREKVLGKLEIKKDEIIDIILDSIPKEAMTLHRLLGYQKGRRSFKHNEENPLSADIIVVDEASMIDQELAYRLLSAISSGSRLILVGDKDQLASVDAGAILGGLCSRADGGHFSSDTVKWLKAQLNIKMDSICPQDIGTSLDDAIVKLRYSHRFSHDKGIGLLAKAVNSGDYPSVITALENPDNQKELSLFFIDNKNDQIFADCLLKIPKSAKFFPESLTSKRNQETHITGFYHYLDMIEKNRPNMDIFTLEEMNKWGCNILESFGRFQVLSALKRGPWGTESLNNWIEKKLHENKKINISKNSHWYEGRPIIITKNDYDLGLFNGDMGITLKIPDIEGENNIGTQQEKGADAGKTGLRLKAKKELLSVVFKTEKGIRWIRPELLENEETAFALTVHKSQGSEFEHTVLILPPVDNPLLTRELLYTGITRAKKHFTLILTRKEKDDIQYKALEILKSTVEKKVQRAGADIFEYFDKSKG